MKSVVSIYGFITRLLGILQCANTVVFGKNHGFKPYLWTTCTCKPQNFEVCTCHQFLWCYLLHVEFVALNCLLCLYLLPLHFNFHMLNFQKLSFKDICVNGEVLTFHDQELIKSIEIFPHHGWYVKNSEENPNI